MTLPFLLLMSLARADEPSAFQQSLIQDTGTKIEESWVVIKDQRFRKYDMQGGLYYLHFRDDQSKVADFYCSPPTGYKTETLIIEPPRLEMRSREFVQAFHEACKSAKANAPAKITLDPKIGLVYPAEKK